MQNKQIRGSDLELAAVHAFLHDRCLARVQFPCSASRSTHLEEISRLPHELEEVCPSCNLCLPRTIDDDLQRFDKVVQEVDDPRQDGVVRDSG